MKNKIIAMMTVVIMATSLGACGSQATEEVEETAAEVEATDEIVEEEVAEEAVESTSEEAEKKDEEESESDDKAEESVVEKEVEKESSKESEKTAEKPQNDNVQQTSSATSNNAKSSEDILATPEAVEAWLTENGYPVHPYQVDEDTIAYIYVVYQAGGGYVPYEDEVQALMGHRNWSDGKYTWIYDNRNAKNGYVANICIHEFDDNHMPIASYVNGELVGYYIDGVLVPVEEANIPAN